MTPEVAIYVPSAKSYAKQTYKVESFSARKFNGLHIVRDALERAGIPVAFTDLSRVADFKVVLYSITASCDWLPWLRERASWPAHARPTVIVGGAGVLNIRPFLGAADAYVFGRGESIAPPLVAAALGGYRIDNPSVIYPDAFSMDRAYTVRQAPPYPHLVTFERGGEIVEYQEHGMGCPRKCFFCAMSWQRRFTGQENFDGIVDAPQSEVRMEALVGQPCEKWARVRTVGLDGVSERLRFRHNKRITNETIKRFMVEFATHRESGMMRFYNIVGLPGEDQRDFDELVNVMREADRAAPVGPKIYIALSSANFRAMPATPSACWPIAQIDDPAKYAALHLPIVCKTQFFYGKRFMVGNNWRSEMFGVYGLAVIALRGDEGDARTLKALAIANFENKPGNVRAATLRKYFDIDTLFGAYTWDTLPTRNVSGYMPNATLAKLDRAFARKYGGHQPQ